MLTVNNMQERSRSLYMTDKGYLEALQRLQALVLSGLPLHYENSDCIGDKYTNCTWGLCSEVKEMWPEPAMHLWPDQFTKHDRIAPLYRLNHHLCPCDTRTVGGNNGCFYTCIIFHRMERLKVFGSTLVKPEDDRFWVEYNRLLVLRIALAENLQEASNANEHG